MCSNQNLKFKRKKPAKSRPVFVKSNIKYVRSKLCLDLFKAVCADTLVIEINNVVRVAAEDA